MFITHDDSYSGHFDRYKTKTLLRRHWYWDIMSRDVDEYVDSCNVYQRTTVKRYCPYDELTLLSMSTRSWIEMLMNFITNLLVNYERDKNVYDMLLIVLDRYIKITRYFFYRKTIIIKQLTNLFLEYIVDVYDTS